MLDTAAVWCMYARAVTWPGSGGTPRFHLAAVVGILAA